MRIPVSKEKKKQLAGGICVLGILFGGFRSVFGTGKWDVYWKKEAENRILSVCAPVFMFGTTDQEGGTRGFLEEMLFSAFPAFSYLNDCIRENGAGPLPIQDDTAWQQLLAREEYESVQNKGSESGLFQQPVSGNGFTEEANAVEEAVKLEEAFEKENQTVRDEKESVSENAAASGSVMGAFVPHQKQMTFNLQDYQDFSALFETFYAMDSNTMVGREQLNLESLLGPEVTIKKDDPGPQILIYHTHSQEGFVDSVPGDKSTTIVGAGDKLTQLLTEQYGYSVLHHTGEYDVGDRDGAYSRSLPALEQILEENPSIQVVIDLHRDGIASDRKLVTDLDGRPTARFMFFNGLSRTKNTGDIDYLYNPYQAQNLALSFRMQLAANEYYPGLTRRIYLNGYRYNMHLRPSLLIELGAQTNTVEEIMNAIDPMAHILDLVFSGEAAH